MAERAFSDLYVLMLIAAKPHVTIIVNDALARLLFGA